MPPQKVIISRQLIGKLKPSNGKYPRPKPKPGTCGSYHTVSGLPCECRDLFPNGRCAQHGGKSRNRKGTPLARKRERKLSLPIDPSTAKKRNVNIYEVGLLEDEKGAVYSDIVDKMGSLDQEIHMTRIFLRRAYWAQKRQTEARALLRKNKTNYDKWIPIGVKYDYISVRKYEHKDGTLHMTPEVKRELQDIVWKRVFRRKNDYTREIRAYTNMLRSLEGQRKDLMENQRDATEEYIAAIAGDLRLFSESVQITMPGKTMFGQGNYNKLKKPDAALEESYDNEE